MRVLLDKRPGKAAAKRWDWVRKGVPLIVEVGPRDMDAGKVALLRRDRLWNADNGKPAFAFVAREEFSVSAGAMLADIQQGMFAQARDRRDAKITRGVETFAEVEEFYTADTRYPGWLEVQWSKPTGDALAQVEDRLKALKLTIRNVPRNAEPADGPCIFTGEKAIERILIARAY